jgi:sporulation protein YlmC with PRC-barrel domain
MKIAQMKWLLGLTLLAASLLLAACAGTDEGDTGTSEAVLASEEQVAGPGSVTPGEADTPGEPANEAAAGNDAAETAEPLGPIEFVQPPSRWITSGRLLGSPVFGEDGIELGRIVDVIFSEQGELGHVVVSAAALGEDTLGVVPWGSVQWVGPEGDLGSGGAQPSEEAAESDSIASVLDTPGPYSVFVYPSADELHGEIAVEARLFRDGALFAGEEILAAVGAEAGEAATREAVSNRVLRLSQFEEFDLSDYPLLDDQGEQIGEIEELIVDLEQGMVAYALVEAGGFMGVGQASLAVPWNAVGLSLTTEEFVLLAPAEVLQDAPAFESDAWANGPADDAWNEAVDEYWADL